MFMLFLKIISCQKIYKFCSGTVFLMMISDEEPSTFEVVEQIEVIQEVLLPKKKVFRNMQQT